MQHLRPHCIIFMHYRSCPITADQTWRSCLAGSDVTKNAEGVVQSLEVTEGIKIYIYIKIMQGTHSGICCHMS